MVKRTTAKKPEETTAVVTDDAEPNFVDVLARCATATATGTVVYLSGAEIGNLDSDPRGPLIEAHPTLRDTEGRGAYRATALGASIAAAGTLYDVAPGPASAPAPVASAAPAWGDMPAVATPAPAAPIAVPAAPKAPRVPSVIAVTIDDGIPIPPISRGGRGRPGYGFEGMNVGQSFFIPQTDENKNPAKRIASTVSSANERLEPKKFAVRRVDETALGRGIGARIWRVI